MNIKEYKNIDELITILESRGLNFSQKQRAKRLLKENNYYCVTAYKKLFYKVNEHIYREGIDFENLYDVYSFDKSFKTIVLKHLLFIEQKIKTAISNQISEKYGVDEKQYLNKNNYDLTNPHLENNLNKIKEQMAKFGEKNLAVKHYKDKYKFIPFWVLSKCLTMGVIRDYFSILKPSDQFIITNVILENAIEDKPVKKAKTMIALFADIRNMCAHDEILIGFVHERIMISEMPELKKLSVDNSKQSIRGRSDILALLICVKYFVNKTMYNEFIKDITSSINKYYKRISRQITKQEFLNYIGLPENYEELKKL